MVTKHYKPLPHLTLTVTRPLVAFGLAFSAFQGVTILFAILYFTLGHDFFPFEASVPIYLRNHITRLRADAVKAARVTANYASKLPATQLQHGEFVDAEGTPLFLELLYVPTKNTNVFSMDILKKIRAVEEKLMNSEGFADYCLREWYMSDHILEQQSAQDESKVERVKSLNRHPPPCQPPLSALWACIPLCKMCSNGPCLEYTPLQPEDPSKCFSIINKRDCSSIESMPAGLLNCQPWTGSVKPNYTDQTGCSPNQMVFQEGFITDKLAQFSKLDNKAEPAFQLFRQLVDKSFGTNNSKGAALRSLFLFGIPLAGYANVQDRQQEQRDKFEKWLNNQVGWLDEQSDSKMRVWFNGYHMYINFIKSLLPNAGFWAFWSFVFGFAYMVLVTKSWFVSLMGMGQILMCFSPAYFIYFICGQRYFGTFNVLAIFIILGIGCDDIYVLWDAWSQSPLHLDEEGYEATLANRMSFTWRRAAKAMLLTSCTTIASFLSNAFSVFPGISTFGIFAACLVLVNFLAVILFFPTVIAMYHTYFEKKKFCFGLCSRGKTFFGASSPPPSPSQSTIEWHSPSMAEQPSVQDVLQQAGSHHNGMGIVENFFSVYYSKKVILRWHFVFVTIAIVITGFSVWGIFKLQPDDHPPQFLKDGTNFQNYYDTKDKYFGQDSGSRAIQLYLVWGLNPVKPIDRAGTLPTDQNDYGKPNFDEHFKPWAQANCMIAMCNNMTSRSNDTLKVDSNRPSTCIMRDLKEWIMAEKYRKTVPNDPKIPNGKILWELMSAEDGSGLPLFQRYAYPWIEEFYSEVKPYLWGTKDGTSGFPTPRMILASVTLTADWVMEYQDGIAVWEAWEYWVNNIAFTLPACRRWDPKTKDTNPSGGYLPVFQTAADPNWEVFFIRKTLTSEAFQGIGMSLGFSLVVLCVATGNPLIALLASLTITMIVMNFIGFTVALGWKLGSMESIIFVLVPGLSVDYVAHLAEGYNEAPGDNRKFKVTTMLTEVGVSILSGAISTLGASIFLLFPTIQFFPKFGISLFMTIALSLVYSLFFFASLLALIGPEKDCCNIFVIFRKMCPKSSESNEMELGNLVQPFLQLDGEGHDDENSVDWNGEDGQSNEANHDTL